MSSSKSHRNKQPAVGGVGGVMRPSEGARTRSNALALVPHAGISLVNLLERIIRVFGADFNLLSDAELQTIESLNIVGMTIDGFKRPIDEFNLVS